jgi:hypothetical protein
MLIADAYTKNDFFRCIGTLHIAQPERSGTLHIAQPERSHRLIFSFAAMAGAPWQAKAELSGRHPQSGKPRLRLCS